MKFHARPFRLGTSTWRWGVVIKWRGKWRAYGRRIPQDASAFYAGQKFDRDNAGPDGL